MYYYYIPTMGYIGVASLLCLIFFCIECAKKKKKENDSMLSISSSSWVSVSAIVGIIMSLVTTQTFILKMPNPLYIIVTILLCCITLIVSSSLIYYS